MNKFSKHKCFIIIKKLQTLLNKNNVSKNIENKGTLSYCKKVYDSLQKKKLTSEVLQSDVS